MEQRNSPFDVGTGNGPDAGGARVLGPAKRRARRLLRSPGQATLLAQPTSLDRWLLQRLCTVLGDPPIRFVLWDGSSHGGHGVARAEVHLQDRGALLGLFFQPELKFGDLYSEGRIEVHGDLVRLIEAATHGLRHLRGNGRLAHLLHGGSHRRINNSLALARDNIHHHYDLGNDFYARWLDAAHMQYTCAYYPDPAMTLEAAQTAKLHHVCRKLRLRPGEHILELGCGWGGLARFMAREYGVTVRAYNISREQLRHARERAEEEGLAARIEYVEEDYRNARGNYDACVSVGMLEHVGPVAYRELGAVIGRCLKPSGRGLIHTIGRSAPGAMNPWIERRIFPGAYPPSLGEMMAIFEPERFVIRDVENLRQHYAQTLRHWLERFDTHAEEIEHRFDARFVRAWRLYLSGSIAAFNTGELQLYQVLFSHLDNTSEPWSRAHLYQPTLH